ncbi:MAG: aldo/keto reductase [Gemmatimonadales bacterium]|nr:aldo/keto reductase [Gemmatimonadales bacterium]NIN09841.1 aldo/keto reductase [Gemmatimonadales bacterium]NIN48544.1 aldo/keto reductase [Gemmatimonadales bacterium]NIP06008.1 aldo/keto reductase [Gemmatimonadales bacterium]NIR01158.1 aldo/keto reductase [Gemmatimonadales bacterium]
MDRRQFVSTVVGVTAGAMTVRPGTATGARSGSTELPTRRLGQSDLVLPILSLGGFHVGRAGSEGDARRLVETAVEEGIRLFDNAESYQSGRAERWVGAALEGMRHEVLLMSKTFNLEQRSAESARRHLEGSLERLRTDYLDLWQLHSIRSVEDVDRAFRAGGAMEYILGAKEQGLVRYVGVTGHVTPAAHRRALEYWDRGFKFDAMQLPLNPIDYHQQSFQQEGLPHIVQRGIGVIAMKTSAQAALLRERICTIDECLRYVWSLPIAVAVVGMERPQEVRHNARQAREFTPMSAAELDALRQRIQSQARLQLEWYKR